MTYNFFFFFFYNKNWALSPAAAPQAWSRHFFLVATVSFSLTLIIQVFSTNHIMSSVVRRFSSYLWNYLQCYLNVLHKIYSYSLLNTNTII
jgi:hypothetical protein